MSTNATIEAVYGKPGKAPNLHSRVLFALVDGDELTTLTALQRFGSLELRKLVADLRAAGFRIADRWEKNASTGKRYKVYFLAA